MHRPGFAPAGWGSPDLSLCKVPVPIRLIGARRGDELWARGAPGASEPQFPLAGAERRAVCCPQEARAISPLGRYLSLALTVSHAQSSWLCEIGPGQARGKIPPFPSLGALCLHGLPPAWTWVLDWTLRLSPCPEASRGCTGSVLLLGHPSGSALLHILSLVPRDESLGCKPPSAPCVGSCPPISILGCSDVWQEGCAQPRSLPLEKINLPVIHLPSCGS